MRVLVCPQEFKGSLNAEHAADAIAAGIRRARPEWEIDLLPLADGGPGFVDALRRAIRCDTVATRVRDPLGRGVVGRYLSLPARREVIIEAAQANGLAHLAPDELAPLRANTVGVGELLLDAMNLDPARIVVGVGGSATTDGGVGMATVLGARLLDASGSELAPEPAALAGLAHIEWACPDRLAAVEFVVATDVESPLLGPAGAAYVFGPQKGANPETVDLLEAGLSRLAEVLRNDLGVDVANEPGAGAAGGLAAGLIAFLGARVESGFRVIAEATGFEERLRQADIVVTGEGRFDGQSSAGKGPGQVLATARGASKRVVVMAGSADGAPGDIELLTLAAREPDAGVAMRDAEPLLMDMATDWARTV